MYRLSARDDRTRRTLPFMTERRSHSSDPNGLGVQNFICCCGVDAEKHNETPPEPVGLAFCGLCRADGIGVVAVRIYTDEDLPPKPTAKHPPSSSCVSPVE